MGVLIIVCACVLMLMLVARANPADRHDMEFGFIIEKAKEQRDNATGVVTVVFADRKYLPVAINWFLHYRSVMKSANASGALLITYNHKDAFNKAQTLGIPCAYSPEYRLPLQQNNDYYHFRILVVDTLIRAGLKVLQSDADAIWLRNPLEYMSTYLTTDNAGDVGIMTSLGTWPHPLFKKWKFTACMGFIYFDGAHFNYTFFFEKWIDCTGDDQGCFNYVIDNHFILRPNTTDNTRVHLVRKLDNTHLKQFDLILLPDTLFVRECSAGDGIANLLDIQKTAIVMHCKANKESKAKSHWMTVAGLWWYNVSKNFTE
jgi:hypothetical protein